MKKVFIYFLLSFSILSQIYGQAFSTKYEFRAAWIATVTNLDWPSANYLTVAQQKNQLIAILDTMRSLNLNVAVFQIRTECDALYDSPYEPWSFWLTGKQGTPPSPYYDPLEFAVQEAHKRGIELHAWFNPYRAVKTVGQYTADPKHVTKQHPDWVFKKGSIEILDPGLPMVREYVRNVILDVVNRYDVDGIHMDDYFYPYEGMGSEDNFSWTNYKRGFTNLYDWRRDNVNLLIRMINDSLQQVKPYVKFGMSPFGIWKSGTPPGIAGLSSYHDIYCDPIAWLHDRSIDYLTPQCYWPIGGGQDYIKLTNWWADSVAANERHFYPGQAYYRQTGWNANEIPRQIRHNRGNAKIQGSVFFRALNFNDNPKGVTDSLRKDLFKYIALIPQMEWKDNIAPNEPQNVRIERVANSASSGIIWDDPAPASDGETGRFFVVHYSTTPDFTDEILNDPSHMVQVTGEKSFVPVKKIADGEELYFAVSSLDRNNNLSIVSNSVKLTTPEVPSLVSPMEAAENQKDTTILVWNYSMNAASYHLQVSANSDFSKFIVDKKGISDSTFSVTGMKGNTVYYWRVASENILGKTEFSETRSFTTGFPVAATLVYPGNEQTGIEEITVFKWKAVDNATEYRLQVVKSVVSWLDNLIILDVKGITDTTYRVDSPFPLSGLYSWRILAGNEYGYGVPSGINKFQITSVTAINQEENQIPEEFALYQNYPNPFNPATEIIFDLPKSGFTSLTIYDGLGREVAKPVNGYMNAGKFQVSFNAGNLATGIYIYSLQSNNFRASRKMVVIK